MITIRRHLFTVLLAVRTSYWFIPSVMACLAIVLGAVMVWIDATFDLDWLGSIGWYQTVRADGAREVLSTIAGSMITVAGVVFSITIVALAYASSQYGPRILTNFMSDRGNTVTLGTFIATFLYCLVVLRTIRGGDEGAFVPQLAVMVGLLLALCSIAVLIFFIHHVPQAIHINHVAANIGRQLSEAVDHGFPASIGDPPQSRASASEASNAALAAFAHPAAGELRAVRGTRTGYIQSIDDTQLMDCASRHDLVLRLRYRPGDFLCAGRSLLDAWPASRVDEDVANDLRETFATGTRRTPHSDMDFLINELVEIATRALSSGVNDPTTARTCIDWLGAGATMLAQRRPPSPHRVDEHGALRVIARPDDFEHYVAMAFGELRQYAAGDAITGLHVLRTLGEVAAACPLESQRAALAAEGDALAALCGELLPAALFARIRERAEQFSRLLAGGGSIDRRQAEWLGRSV